MTPASQLQVRFPESRHLVAPSTRPRIVGEESQHRYQVPARSVEFTLLNRRDVCESRRLALCRNASVGAAIERRLFSRRGFRLGRLSVPCQLNPSTLELDLAQLHGLVDVEGVWQEESFASKLVREQ